jgi:tannase/feruloyl esterase
LAGQPKIGGPEPNILGSDFIKYVVFKNAKWDWRTFDFETAVALADEIDNGTMNATNPDLRAFRQRGGKLLLFHGWSDPNFSAQSTIDYYKRVLDTKGSAQSAEWLRLFLAPGMGQGLEALTRPQISRACCREAWCPRSRRRSSQSYDPAKGLKTE